jgi:low affinity Fe/Cu permease
MKKSKKKKSSAFEKIAIHVTKASGSTGAFIIAFGVIVIWLISGPFFQYSDTWQLVINTGTTIITFLMVFLIQRSQNKDSIAIHLKLNELVVANELASNRLISIEDISEEELMVLHKFYQRLAKLAKEEMSVEQSHSNLVANARHDHKSNSFSQHNKSAQNKSKS